MDENGFCIFNGGCDDLFSISSGTTKYYHILTTSKSRTKMGRAVSGPEFRVNFGSGCDGSLHLWFGLGRVKKI